MFEYTGFVNRNPLYALKNWRGQYKVRKVMLQHKKENPECSWCGTEKNLHVHHDIPVQVSPLLAADPDNMTTACRDCHRIVFHNRHFRDRYAKNPRKLCIMNDVVKVTKLIN